MFQHFVPSSSDLSGSCSSFPSDTVSDVQPSEFLCILFTNLTYFIYIYIYGDCDGTVVKVLCYKSEGRWFDSRWCHWNFSLT